MKLQWRIVEDSLGSCYFAESPVGNYHVASPERDDPWTVCFLARGHIEAKAYRQWANLNDFDDVEEAKAFAEKHAAAQAAE